MRVAMTDEDLAIARRLHSLGVLESYQRGDDYAARLMRDAVVARERTWNGRKLVATASAWRLAHQGFTDPLNPGMDCIPASEL